MQTRNPYDPSPPLRRAYLWGADAGEAVMTAPPIDDAYPAQAFRADGEGGITIAVGVDPVDDPVWRVTDGELELRT